MKKLFTGRGLHFLLLGVVAAAGLPLAIADYDYRMPDPGRIAESGETANRIGALLPYGNRVRAGHWTVAELSADPVERTAAARRRVDDLPRYRVTLAQPFGATGGATGFTAWLGAIPRWLAPPAVSFDSVGRVREFRLGIPTRAAMLRRSKDLRESDGAAWQAETTRQTGLTVVAFGISEPLGACASLETEDVSFDHAQCGEFVQLGKTCFLWTAPGGPVHMGCKPLSTKPKTGNLKGQATDEPARTAGTRVPQLVTAALLGALAGSIFFFAFLRRLFKGAWDLKPAFRAGLLAGGLILAAWPFPLEWRAGIFGWPLAALFFSALTAATLAAFLGSVRDASEEAAAPIEAAVTRRLLTREVLAGLAEGALGALALLGACALIDHGLYALGWKHWPFLPAYSIPDHALSPRDLLFALRTSALTLPVLTVWVWFQFRIHQWLLHPAARLLAPLFAALTLGALVGVAAAPAPALALALGSWLFLRRGSEGGLLALLAAGLFWPLAPLALRAPPLGEGGLSAALAALLFAAVFALAAWGARGAPSLADGEPYIPAYVLQNREQTRLQRELEIARSVQQRFLPSEAPAVPGLEIAFHCTPAMEVGGDYFDFLPRDGAFDVVVGDVSGKGVASSFYMTLAKGILHTLSRQPGIAPIDIVRRLNAIFHDNSPQGVFLTLAYASYEPATGELDYLRAGHNACLIRRADGRVERLMPPGMIIGFDPGPRFDSGLGEARARIEPGDTVVLYTDGVSEAMNGRGEEYGENRLSALLEGSPAGAQAALDTVVGDVVRFCAGEKQRDDLTLVVFHRKPA